jgi:uncharacterized protein YbjT (DUF2867 family)
MAFRGVTTMASTVAVMGATGHVGGAIARGLREAGVAVRAIGRSRDRLQPLAQAGAEIAEGSVDDAAFLAHAFDGAAAAFVMVPPNLQASDARGYQRRVAEVAAAAITKTGLSHAVMLSSVGADKATGTGPIEGLHEMEMRLDAIAALHVVHLRPAYFMENHMMSIGLIKSAGINGTPLRPDLSMPTIATKDIAAVAADLLARRSFTGHATKELQGPRDYTPQEATAILGMAIGRPDLPYAQFPYEDALKAMTAAGLSPSVAADFVELYRGLNEGRVTALEPRSGANTTPTTLEEFAATVFAPAFGAS